MPIIKSLFNAVSALWGCTTPYVVTTPREYLSPALRGGMVALVEAAKKRTETTRRKGSSCSRRKDNKQRVNGVRVRDILGL